jgi:hypothetical protein
MNAMLEDAPAMKMMQEDAVMKSDPATANTRAPSPAPSETNYFNSLFDEMEEDETRDEPVAQLGGLLTLTPCLQAKTKAKSLNRVRHQPCNQTRVLCPWLYLGQQNVELVVHQCN